MKYIIINIIINTILDFNRLLIKLIIVIEKNYQN